MWSRDVLCSSNHNFVIKKSYLHFWSLCLYKNRHFVSSSMHTIWRLFWFLRIYQAPGETKENEKYEYEFSYASLNKYVPRTFGRKPIWAKSTWQTSCFSFSSERRHIYDKIQISSSMVGCSSVVKNVGLIHLLRWWWLDVMWLWNF